MAVKIYNVLKNSIAEKANLCAGMYIVAIDGHEIKDGLDYEFYAAGENLLLEMELEGKRFTVTIQKQEYEPLGCEFETYLIDKQHSCKNGCVFCFVDQMPKGMRSSLYFKDDDERLSFLFGNYITLTNLNDKEVQRIIDMRISPVNISVHTANPKLRVEMMKNKHSGDVLRYIPQLAKAGIEINTQLVLCPGINDGEELKHSIEWLAQFAPSLQSIAAVPVGLTKFRKGLFPLKPYTKEQAFEQLEIMLAYGDKFKREKGVRLIYPSDEWFLNAGVDIPEEDFYDGYLQLENGVGMCRLLEDEFLQALEEIDTAAVQPYEVDVVTGVLAAPLLYKLAKQLHEKLPAVTMHVHAIKNDFFGETITVTGLLTGTDLLKQLRGKMKTNTLLLPDVTLRAEGDLFLDDISVEELAQKLGCEIEVVQRGGDDLLYAVLGQE